jgi:hypothetical protein
MAYGLRDRLRVLRSHCSRGGVQAFGFQVLGFGFRVSGFGLRHTQDSQGQILALAFRFKSLKPVQHFPLRSQADAGPGMLKR